MSLQKKTLAVLLIIPVLTLPLLLYSLVNVFKNDKSVYLYEYQRVSLESLAVRLGYLLEKKYEKTEELDLLVTQDLHTNKLEILKNKTGHDLPLQALARTVETVCKPTHGLLWWPLVKKEQSFFLGCRYKDGKSWIYGWEGTELQALLRELDLTQNYLITQDGWIVFSDNEKWAGKKITEVFPSLKVSFVTTGTYSFGRMEMKDKESKDFLMSFRRLSGYPLTLISGTPENVTVEAAMPFLVRGVLTLFTLLVITFLAGLVLSRTLTVRILNLSQSIQRLGMGDLNHKVQVEGNDEVSRLSEVFNEMTSRLSLLMKEKEKKALVDYEMATAASLQKQFFPLEFYQSNEVDVRAFYESATSCGGDWWFYFKNSDEIIVCIADVTGHGLRSAMVTGAARAALASHEKNFISPRELMRLFNEAIYQTTRGELQMTCLIISYHFKKQELTYCNASHEMPVLVQKPLSGESQNSVVILTDIHGPRTGEKAEAVYSETSVKLAGRAGLFLYSDGLSEMVNTQGRSFGDRRVVKMLSQLDLESERAYENLKMKVDEFRSGTSLNDDLSYMFMLIK